MREALLFARLLANPVKPFRRIRGSRGPLPPCGARGSAPLRLTGFHKNDFVEGLRKSLASPFLKGGGRADFLPKTARAAVTKLPPLLFCSEDEAHGEYAREPRKKRHRKCPLVPLLAAVKAKRLSGPCPSSFQSARTGV